MKALGAATAGLAAVSADAWAEDGPMAAAIHHHLEAAEQGAVPAHAKFFQPQEFRTVERLADLILPSDGTPGAKDAGVAEFLDFYLAGSPDSAQMQFRKGLLGVEAIAKSKFGKPFVDLGEREQTQLLETMSGAGAEPEQRAFFQNMRRLTVFGLDRKSTRLNSSH